MPGSELRKNLLIAAALVMGAAGAQAQNVFVTTIAANQVQVIVDGTAIRTLRVGDTSPEGVRLVEIRQGAAVFDIRGRAIALGLGQSTVIRTTLQADGRGQFMTYALINGVRVPAVIDTGATHVTLNMAHALQMGIDVRGAQRSLSYTANGPTYGYVVALGSVQVGDIVLRNVVGKVLEGGNESLPIALIGMSFLKQVEMHRTGATMTLSRPHLQ
jgi:aspartyl protease family protein